MTSTDESDRGGPGSGSRSPRPAPSSPSPPRRERFYADSANSRRSHTSASARPTWRAPSREELSARKRSVLDKIQAEADAAVDDLEDKQRSSRSRRRQSRMNSPLEAVDANYMDRVEAQEKEEDIEELFDILLEEYGIEVERLPEGARAPIYAPTVRPAWPVTEERVGREGERRSRRELESSEEEDEELVKSMSRGQTDRLMAQTSLRGTNRGYARPSGGGGRRRRDPDVDSNYEGPSQPRPRPRGPGPAPYLGGEAAFIVREDETRERKRDLEREREIMREEIEREIRRERDLRSEELEREMMREEIEREVRRERDLRREELERETARRQRAEDEEEWNEMHRHTFETTTPIIIRDPPYPPPDPQYDQRHRSHSEYELHQTESRREPPTTANAAYDAEYISGAEMRRRQRWEHQRSAPRSRSRSRSRPRLQLRS